MSAGALRLIDPISATVRPSIETIWRILLQPAQMGRRRAELDSTFTCIRLAQILRQKLAIVLWLFAALVLPKEFGMRKPFDVL